MPSCSQMRLQLLHFHAVFKTWPTFQELTSIVSFRRRRWSQRNFSENRNIQGNQSKDVLSKIRGLRRNIFSCLQRWRPRSRLLEFPNYLGRKALSHNMESVCSLSFWVCRLCPLDGDWFAARLLSAHHMLGQWTSVEEWFEMLLWLINTYAPCHIFTMRSTPI